ncbi:MAG TPA: nicotinate-nicotinamide nucleotide adenylyltransferase [Candidatus Dormibacteraeota bacterium]|nr:nicotinate-nicotinamide nucleotide adenylyltransferase [Candidatus Dormibacteraeota bacterium]
MKSSLPKRIGIYAGTFNPVHSGHLSFALQARQVAKLDQLYFLPERCPRSKQSVEHFAHRVAMLKQACRPYHNFKVLELDELSFSVRYTLPKLEARFDTSQLVLLLGSDVLSSLLTWPLVDRLLQSCELVVAVRDGDDKTKISQLVASWSTQPKGLTVFNSYASTVSSATVRQALGNRQPTDGLLSSVADYANRNWLYISL